MARHSPYSGKLVAEPSLQGSPGRPQTNRSPAREPEGEPATLFRTPEIQLACPSISHLGRSRPPKLRSSVLPGCCRLRACEHSLRAPSCTHVDTPLRTRAGIVSNGPECAALAGCPCRTHA